MIYVVAGNHEQAYEYINRKLEERIRNGEQVSKVDDYTYVRDVNVLRGILNPKGVFIGSWKERKDIKDIVQQLMVSQSHVNPVLIKIWKEVRNEPVRVTPRQPSQGYQRWLAGLHLRRRECLEKFLREWEVSLKLHFDWTLKGLSMP